MIAAAYKKSGIDFCSGTGRSSGVRKVRADRNYHLKPNPLLVYPALVLLFTLLSGLAICPISAVAYSSADSILPPFSPMIDSQVQELMAQNYVPTVTTAVVRNDSIIWAKGYGEQTELDIIHMTGSVTKTFTATAIFQLYERGLIQLDDDINEYLPFSLRHPNYPDTPITIRMLLIHYSGLAKDTDQYIAGMAEDAAMRIGLENPYNWLPFPYWIEEHLIPNGSLYVPDAWTPNKPGTSRHYSNLGYNVLGYILQLVTGNPIWEYMDEHIFVPLEMDSTGYNFSEFDASQLAIPYIYQLDVDPESTGNQAYPHYNYLGYSSGAIRSNIYDLARFLLVYMHNGVSNGTRILEENTIQIMHQMEASWLCGNSSLINWEGWGGTEGDTCGFHTKAYAIHDGNTTVPYAVITFLNQGCDDARDICFSITTLLRQYVHRYDVLEYMPFEIPLVLSISGIAMVLVLVILVRRRMG